MLPQYTDASQSPPPPPDSPSSDISEFPIRNQAVSSSKEAANAALLNQTGTTPIRLQAVLIPPGASQDVILQGVEGFAQKIKQASKKMRFTKENGATQPNKRRFSLDAFKLPFRPSKKDDSNGILIANLLTQSTGDPFNQSPTSTHAALPPLSIDQVSIQQSFTHSQSNSIASSHHTVPFKQEAASPVRSAMSNSNLPGKVARAVSPHRVSFSPSTGEAVEARENARLVLAQEEQERKKKQKRLDSNEKKQEGKKFKKDRPVLSLFQGFKSFSTSNLDEISRPTTKDSVDSQTAQQRLGSIGLSHHGHRRFVWDQYGIRQNGASMMASKAKLATAKVSKQQAIAARHARTLEQVINAGMGIHPAFDRSTSGSDRVWPIPIVNPADLKGLKSALLDVNLANGIIGELRAMQLPLSLTGVGSNSVGQPSRDGREPDHIISSPIPESSHMLRGSQDDSQIALVTSQSVGQTRPLLKRQHSDAEEALRKIHLTTKEQIKAKVLPSGKGKKAPLLKRSASEPQEVSKDDGIALESGESQPNSKASSGTRPIKGVCLDYDEVEAHQRHSDHLKADPSTVSTNSIDEKSKADVTASISAGVKVRGLITDKDARQKVTNETLGQSKAAAKRNAPHQMARSKSLVELPVLENGKPLMGSSTVQLIFSPTATAIGKGGQMSGAFDALAAVSGAAVHATTNMDTIRPPLDRMAIFVHWWGFELTLPKPTIVYLSTAHSISGAFLTFLQTMVVTGGVPELLPFIRYISMFMDVEFKAIQEQDHGHGVCIAATWFMPLALVPRPWDYSTKGPVSLSFLDPVLGHSSDVATLASTSNVSRLGKISSDGSSDRPNQIYISPRGRSLSPAVSNSDGTAIPKRILTPSQLAAIQVARSEKIPTPHSRSSSMSSIDSVKSKTISNTLVHSESVKAALESVVEIPE